MVHRSSRSARTIRNSCLMAFLLVAGAPRGAPQQVALSSSQVASPLPAMVNQYCTGCHNSAIKQGELDLDNIRLEESTYNTVVEWLSDSLDKASAGHPKPGRTDTFRRLNRTEYQNAIRDLLALDIDATELLPKDEVSHGFDNVTAGDLSPTLLDRYISASQIISRFAIGPLRRSPGGDTFRIRADLTQEEHVEGLPVGTRVGVLIPYAFPRAGEYEVQIRLTRNRNEDVEGLRAPHELELLLDRERLKFFTMTPPPDKNYERVDQKLKLRFSVTADPHQLGVTFLKTPSALLETKHQPYQAHFKICTGIHG